MIFSRWGFFFWTLFLCSWFSVKVRCSSFTLVGAFCYGWVKVVWLWCFDDLAEVGPFSCFGFFKLFVYLIFLVCWVCFFGVRWGYGGWAGSNSYFDGLFFYFPLRVNFRIVKFVFCLFFFLLFFLFVYFYCALLFFGVSGSWS